MIVGLVAFAGLAVGQVLQSETNQVQIGLAGLAVAGIGFVILLIGWRQELAKKVARTAFRIGRPAAPALLAFGLCLTLSAIDFFVFDFERNQKQNFALFNLKALTTGARTFEVRHGSRPDSLEQVGQYIDGGSDMCDPWGRPYQYDRDGPRNDGKQPDIWTVSPRRELIGNWMLDR